MTESQANKSESDFLANLIGKEFAGCRVLKKLGQGAMGTVFLGEQLSLGRQVAIKILDPKFSSDDTYIGRFEREARAAAQLGQFNIVQVFGVGHDLDQYYIISEYVDGGNVQELIDKVGIIDSVRATEIILHACRGLEAAADQNIVHRDIKPDNLMLNLKGDIKLADFGLAKVVQDNAAVTQSGMIVGTPYYMSPEQAKGQSLDKRSDIYSLGVTFFYMVTGQLPFDADSVIGVLLKQISAERPDPVVITPGLPSDVGRVIMKMMARNPAERYQDAGELVELLEDVLLHISKRGKAPQRTTATPDKEKDRFSRYKILRSSHIINLMKREMDRKTFTRMMKDIKGDSGVFIDTSRVFPENTIVDIRFTIPERQGEFRAIGVVRWVSEDPTRRGMGVTFLKVRSAEGAAESVRKFGSGQLKASYIAPQVTLRPEDAVEVLSATQLQCRLLRYYYANIGETVTLVKVSGALGVGKRMIDEPLAKLAHAGIMRYKDDNTVSFLWPEEEILQKNIVAWITKYGLM